MKEKRINGEQDDHRQPEREVEVAAHEHCRGDNGQGGAEHRRRTVSSSQEQHDRDGNREGRASRSSGPNNASVNATFSPGTEADARAPSRDTRRRRRRNRARSPSRNRPATRVVGRNGAVPQRPHLATGRDGSCRAQREHFRAVQTRTVRRHRARSSKLVGRSVSAGREHRSPARARCAAHRRRSRRTSCGGHHPRHARTRRIATGRPRTPRSTDS